VPPCRCTQPLNYGTATTAADINRAWYILFTYGDTASAFKTLQFHARAVRGGN